MAFSKDDNKVGFFTPVPGSAGDAPKEEVTRGIKALQATIERMESVVSVKGGVIGDLQAGSDKLAIINDVVSASPEQAMQVLQEATQKHETQHSIQDTKRNLQEARQSHETVEENRAENETSVGMKY